MRARVAREDLEDASGGTLFLDEVGEMSLSAQVRLLRVLQDGEFTRVGGNEVLKAEVRVIAASNVDLEKSHGRQEHFGVTFTTGCQSFRSFAAVA